jgi:signal transduction histidine kinase
LDIGRVLQTPDGKFSGYLGACFDITERKRSEEVLLLNQEQLKCMAGELLQAEERERKRIASDLHDRIGQNLILSKIRLKRLTGELNGRAAALLIDDIVKLIDDSIQQVRSLTFQISPPLLYEVGLEVAVESLADRFFEDHGLKVDIRVNYESLLLGENLRVTLYQMVRELLLNIVKHVAPRDVLIVFDKSDSLSIMVQDNGIGFNVEEVMSVKKSSKGYGLYNIKQNLELVNGSMTIDSSIGRGTRVVLNVPL